MRIGIDARMFGQKQTGIGIYIENLIKNILKLDDKNEYVLFLKNPSNETIEYFKKYKNIKIVLVSSEWYSWREQLIFPWQIFKERVDLMHFPHFNVPVFCPVKFVVTIHDMTPKYFPGNKVGKSFFRRKMFDLVMGFALNKSKKIIAVSQFTKSEILRFYQKIPKEKIEVIYEGLREEFLNNCEIPQEYALSETLASLSNNSSSARDRCAFEEQPQANLFGVFQYDCEATGKQIRRGRTSGAAGSGVSVSEKAYLSLARPYVFYTGVWRNHKNLVGLIKAFKILKDKYKIPHALVLGGNEDPSYPEVRKTWEKLHLEKDIILPGFLNIEDQIFLYRNCYLYVSPSFSEGFGFTPLEAMSQGAVVALSDIPAHREISGDLPVYFNPKSPEDMAEKIYFALSDKGFRDGFLSQSVEFAKKYQWQNCASDTLTKVYKYDNI